eukprot:65115_1
MSNSTPNESVRVFLRVRPPIEREQQRGYQQCVEVRGDNVMSLKGGPSPHEFTYDYVAGVDTTQEEVFRKVGKPITDSCLAGYNTTIFAYGQTGSGKTFTMVGGESEDPERAENLRGLIPRVFEYLFRQMAHNERTMGDSIKYLCKCSCIEVYNEQLYDLLQPDKNQNLSIRDDLRRGIYIDGLSEFVIGNTEEALAKLDEGQRNRRIAETAMNRESSRSHCVFILTVQSTETKDGIRKTRTACFNLVDLAGSERQTKTLASGERLREAGTINNSLSCLGNVIMALVQIANGRSRYIPYRDSKLTFLLKDSLGGNSLTFIVANVSPAACNYGETYSTLKFAQRAKFIKNKAHVNEDESGSVTALKTENVRLREKIRQLEALRGAEKEEGEGSDREGPPMTPRSSSATLTPFRTPIGGMRLKRSAGVLNQVLLEREATARDRSTVLESKNEHLQQLVDALKKHVQSADLRVRLKSEAIQRMAEVVQGETTEGVSQQELFLEQQLSLLEGEMETIRNDKENKSELIMKVIQNLDLKSKLKAASKWQTENELIKEVRKLERSLSEALDALHKKSSETPNVSETPETLDPEALLAAMSTPQRQRFQDMEMMKWRESQSFDKKKQELDDQIRTLKEELDSANRGVNLKQTSVNEMSQAMNCQKEESGRREIQLLEAIEGLKREHSRALESLTNEHMNSLDRLQKKHESDIEGFQAFKKGIKSAHISSNLDLHKSRVRCEQLTGELRVLRSQLSGSQEEAREAKKCSEAIKCALEVKEKELSASNEQHSQEMLEWAANIERTMDQLKSERAALRASQKELVTSRENSASLRSNSYQLTKLLGKSKEVNLKLSRQIDVSLSESTKLEGELRARTNELQRTRTNLDGAKEELESRQVEIRFITKQLGDSSSKCVSLSSELEAMKSASADLSVELDSEREGSRSLREQLQTVLEDKSEGIRIMQLKNSELSAELSDCRESLQSAFDADNRLKEELQSTSRTVEQIRNELSAKHQALSDSQAGLNQAQDEWRLRAKQIEEADRSRVEVEAKLEEKEKEIWSQTLQLSNHDATITDLQEKLNISEIDHSAELEIIQKEMCEWRSECAKSKAESERAREEKISSVTALRAEIREASDTHRTRLTEMERTHAEQMERATRANETKSGDLVGKLRKIEAESFAMAAELEKTRTESSTKIGELTSMLSAETKRYLTEHRTHQELKDRMEKLVSSMNFDSPSDCSSTGLSPSAASALEKVRQRFMALQNEYENEKQSHSQTADRLRTELSDQLKMSEGKMSELSEKLKYKDTTVAELRSQIADISGRAKESSASFAKRKDAYERMSANWATQKEYLNNQLSMFRAEKDKISAEKKAKDSECSKLGENIRRLETALEQSTSRSEHQTSQLESLNSQKSEWEATETGFVKKVSRLEKELSAASARLETAQSRCAEALSARERAVAEEERQFDRAEQLQSERNEQSEQSGAVRELLERSTNECERLREANILLSGHQNLKQKIHFHMKLKEENQKLKTSCNRMSKELSHFRQLFGRNRPELAVGTNLLAHLQQRLTDTVALNAQLQSDQAVFLERLRQMPEVREIIQNEDENAEMQPNETTSRDETGRIIPVGGDPPDNVMDTSGRIHPAGRSDPNHASSCQTDGPSVVGQSRKRSLADSDSAQPPAKIARLDSFSDHSVNDRSSTISVNSSAHISALRMLGFLTRALEDGRRREGALRREVRRKEAEMATLENKLQVAMEDTSILKKEIFSGQDQDTNIT